MYNSLSSTIVIPGYNTLRTAVKRPNVLPVPIGDSMRVLNFLFNVLHMSNISSISDWILAGLYL